MHRKIIFNLLLLLSIGFKHVEYDLGLEQYRITEPKSRCKAILQYLLRFINSILFSCIVINKFIFAVRDIEMSIVWQGKIFYKEELFSFNKRIF